MKTFKNIVCWLCIIASVLFFINSASDIQLGFGLVLGAMGILNYQK